VGKNFWQDKESHKISTKTEIDNLRNEIKETQKKQAEMLDMLKESSASDRIKAVNFSYKMKENNPEVLDALIETLNHDENSNVRLAAANALFTFREVDKVRIALISALKNQEDPVVKIALVNMMIAMKEKKAVKTIEEFLQNEPLPDVAKDAIRKKLNEI
jgi:HEAT repeat protein